VKCDETHMKRSETKVACSREMYESELIAVTGVS